MMIRRSSSIAVFSLAVEYARANPLGGNFLDTVGDGLDLSNLPVTSTFTSTLSQSFWRDFRATLANRLVAETTISPNHAYQQIYDYFPEDGNCWCHMDKTQAEKGPRQDNYDTACQHFHNCIHCGHFKEGEEEIKKRGLETEFKVDIHEIETVELQYYESSFSDMFAYSEKAGEMSIFDWQCSAENTGASDSVCQCFKAFEDRWLQQMLTDIAASDEAELAIDFSYSQVCNRGPVNDANPLDGRGLATGNMADACCGEVAPWWALYNTNNGARACCNGSVYDTATNECCETGDAHVTVIGNCAEPTCEADQVYSTDAPGCVETLETCIQFGNFVCEQPNEARCVCSDDKPIWDSVNLECKSSCKNDALNNARFGNGLHEDNGSAQLSADRALDGKLTHGNENKAYAMSNYSEDPKDSPTFYADLKTSCEVAQVIVYPRQDDGHEKYDEMTVTLDGDEKYFRNCAPVDDFGEKYVSGALETGLVFICEQTGESAAYVKVTNPAEVEIQIAEITAECV